MVSLAIVSSALAQEADVRDSLLAPLPIRDQFLLSNGFFFFSPEGPSVLDDGVWSFSTQTTDANTFAKSAWISHSLEGRTGRAAARDALADPRFHIADSLFFVDGETHRTDFTLRRGFGSHLELMAALPLTRTGGGWSDRLIESAHQIMNIGNAGRETLRRNHETVYLRDGDQTYMRTRGNGFAVGDLTLSAKYELAPMEDEHVKLAVVGAVELPLASAQTLDGSGSIDGGIEVVASRDFDHSRVNASIGILRLGANQPLGTRPQFLMTNTVGIAHNLTTSSAVVAQLTVSESPFRKLDLPEFSRRTYQLSTGVRRQFGPYFLHAAFIENVVTFENSADAGFAWGVSRRF